MSRDHPHHGHESGARRALVVALNLLITVAEVIGEVISGSLSLLSDALHDLSDGIAGSSFRYPAAVARNETQTSPRGPA